MKNSISKRSFFAFALAASILFMTPTLYSQFNEEHDSGGSGTCGNDPGGNFCYECGNLNDPGEPVRIGCVSATEGRGTCTVTSYPNGNRVCETSGAFCQNTTVTP